LNNIRKKVGLQFIVSNGSMAAHFGLSIVLARLLTPSEIGIFSITAVFVGFAQVFRDFGVVSFIKRQKSLDPEVLRAAIGVLLTSSWIIAAALYFSTNLIATFFKQPGVKDIMPILALGFVFIPFGSIPQAVLARNVDVAKTTLATALSTVVYITTCITLAKLGFSYMSMAWANLAGIVTSGIALTLMMPKGLPFLPSLKGWKTVINFGAGAMAASSLKALDTAIPDLLLGKLSGPRQVGIYSRANSTVNILNTVTSPTINYFALPYLAKAHHDGHDLSLDISRTVGYLTGFMWPALVVTSLMSDDIIMFLYGPAWRDSAIVVPWLCAVCSIQICFAIVQPALTAMGRPYLSAVPVALVLVVKITLALFLFDGTLISFARAVAIAETVSIPVYIYITTKHVNMGWRAWWQAVRGSTLVSFVILMQGMLFDRWIFASVLSPFFSLLIAMTWLLPGWFIAIIYLKHPLLAELKKILQIKY
jgi:O-antigen/teichoic acid export membrane protein